MFNTLLSIFLFASFLITWAAIGSVLIKLNEIHAFITTHLNHFVELEKAQYNTFVELYKVLKEYQENIENHKKQLDVMHGMIIDIDNNTKKNSKVSKKEKNNEKSSEN